MDDAMTKLMDQDEAPPVVVEGSVVPAPAPPNLQAVPAGVIRPVAAPEEVLAAWQQFQELKRSLLTLDDYQDIQGRARIKKSGWRKIAAAFGISDALLREERRECEGPGGARYFVWEVSVRALAPNGRYADAVGACASNERRFAHTDHDVRAIAHTRAKNRAVADLVGGGEVSAEELEGELNLHQAAVAARSQPALAVRSARPEAPRPLALEAAPGAPADRVTDGQLRAIRAHLQRTGIDEARACARAGVERLDELTRRQASDLLAQLARQPNAA